MKKLLTLLMLTLLLLPTVSFAREGQQRQTATNTGILEPQLISTGDNVNNQNQIQVQVKSITTTAQQGEGPQQNGIHEPGTGLEEPEVKETEQATQSKNALNRRSQVATAVQAMVKVAEKNKGVGEQIRTIAQNQNKIQEQAENALATAQKRSNFARFFIGPNYGELNEVQKNLDTHIEKLEELKTLKKEISNSDALLLDEQIEKMETITTELEEEITQNKKGFSLFGWLNRMFSK